MVQTSKRSCCTANLKNILSPNLFKALCDPTRLAILAHLAESCQELTVSDVARCCPIDLSVVSRHLALMKEVGILKAVKRGKEVFYSVQAEVLVKTLRGIADAIEQCCPPQKEKSDERKR